MFRLILVSIVCVLGCIATDVCLAGNGCGDQVATPPQPAPSAPITARQEATVGSAVDMAKGPVYASQGAECTECQKQARLAAPAASSSSVTASQNVKVDGSSKASSGPVLARMGKHRQGAPSVDQTVITKPQRNGPIGRLLGLDHPSIKQTEIIRN